MTTPDTKPKPALGRPRKLPGQPKSPYSMTEAARKARTKAGRAGVGEAKKRGWIAMIRNQAAKLEAAQ